MNNQHNHAKATELLIKAKQAKQQGQSQKLENANVKQNGISKSNVVNEHTFISKEGKTIKAMKKPKKGKFSVKEQ